MDDELHKQFNDIIRDVRFDDGAFSVVDMVRLGMYLGELVMLVNDYVARQLSDKDSQLMPSDLAQNIFPHLLELTMVSSNQLGEFLELNCTCEECQNLEEEEDE